jgi:integrase
LSIRQLGVSYPWIPYLTIIYPRGEMTDLRTKTARSRIKPNSNGYAQNLSTGRALLYRKRTAGKAGKWMLRTAKDQGGYGFEVLGTADDFTDSDGVIVLTYAQAMEQALGRTNADPTKITVADALTDWATEKKRTTSSDKRAKDIARSALRLSEAFPRATLRSLTAKQIESWKQAEVAKGDDPRARSATVNRQLSNLNAALTRSADLNGYQGNRAWLAVSRFSKAESFGNRKVILTEGEEVALIAAADPDLSTLLTALQMTGARYGEIRSALVGDLEGDRLDLTGKTGKRTINLSPRIAAWFASQSGNRPALAPLLLRADLTAWPDGGQLKSTLEAVAAAGLGEGVTTYTLRHGFISRALAKGVPISAVAEHCGTSVQMITDSYAKFIPSQMQEWFA